MSIEIVTADELRSEMKKLSDHISDVAAQINQRVSDALARHEPQALSEVETAKLIGVSRHTLRSWRMKGDGRLKPITGAKPVRYARADIDAFLRNR